jgi:hypothetical protein
MASDEDYPSSLFTGFMKVILKEQYNIRIFEVQINVAQSIPGSGLQ